MHDGLAYFSGAEPQFKDPLPVGQLYIPEWSQFQQAMAGVFERRWYTNHGPLAQKLEEELAQFFNVKHVVCVTNATIGLLMAADALELTGRVIVPSHTFIATAQSLRWCGLEPVFCDVDPRTQQIDPKKAEQLISGDVSAILGVHLWGGACDVTALDQLCRRYKLKLYFDSAHAFGCEIDGQPAAGFGDLEVFSFHATKVLSATEGGCITTNNDVLAARLRNIRSSYGAGQPVAVTRTSNGRMSEAQAAIALMSLHDFPQNRARNRKLFDVYEERLSSTPGIQLLKPVNVTQSNYQYATCVLDPDVFGLSRDLLLQLLHAENVIARRYFYPATHRAKGFEDQAAEISERLAVTEWLTRTGFQLPLGARVDSRAVDRIGELVARIQAVAPQIARRASRSS